MERAGFHAAGPNHDDDRTQLADRRRGVRGAPRRRGTGLGRQDQASDRGVLRARQDHRPDHLLRGRDRRDGAIRIAADHAARVLLAPADRSRRRPTSSPKSTKSRRTRPSPHLHRLDVRRQPGDARRRASRLRHLADRLQRRHADHPRGARGRRRALGRAARRRPDRDAARRQGRERRRRRSASPSPPGRRRSRARSASAARRASPPPPAAAATPAPRNPPTRRFFPTDSAPIPPANIPP